MIIHIFQQKYIFFGKNKKTPQEKFPRGEYNRSLGSFYRLIKGKEEEIGSYSFTRNALCSANAGTGTVADGAVVFNLADAGARTVADGAVVVDFSDAGAGAVADGAVPVDFSDAGARTVADGAVVVKMTDAGAAGVTDGAIVFNLSAA